MRVYPGYRREFGVRIPGWVLQHRSEILRHYRRSAAQKVEPPAPQIAPPAPTPKRALTVASPSAEPPKAPRLLLATEDSPNGPWIPAPPSLFMPALLALWRAHIGLHVVEVDVREAVRAPVQPWIRQTDAQRQCRRQT